jgi:CheY-like chemotaxis protein
MVPMRNERDSGAGGAPTILVVDDDPDVRDVLALVLELEGYAVERAIDGLDALLALRTAPLPAAIVLDLEMPSMAGVEFRAAQLRDPALARIPVLVLSASGRTVGAQLRLPKPVEPEALVRAVRELAGPPRPARAGAS